MFVFYIHLGEGALADSAMRSGGLLSMSNANFWAKREASLVWPCACNASALANRIWKMNLQ